LQIFYVVGKFLNKKFGLRWDKAVTSGELRAHAGIVKIILLGLEENHFCGAESPAYAQLSLSRPFAQGRLLDRQIFTPLLGALAHVLFFSQS